MVDLVRILDTYTLEEILELNDITPLELLELLIDEEIVTKLEPVPVDASFE